MNTGNDTTTDSVLLRLVSPERMLLEEAAEMVVVPGADGDFGVLPGHAPLMSALRPGLLALYSGGQVRARFFIAGGFAEVSENQCSVLVDAAEDLADLDEHAINEEINNRRDDLKLASGDEDMAAAEKALAIAQAKLETLKSPSY